jgi:hypothetical protein
MAATVNIPKFNVSSMALPRTHITAHIVGRRGCGKTVLACELTKHLGLPAVLHDPLANICLPPPDIFASVEDSLVRLWLERNKTLVFDNLCNARTIGQFQRVYQGHQTNIIATFDVAPPAHMQADYIFCFRQHPSSRRNVWSTYCSDMPFQTFCTIFDECSQVRGNCLVIDNRRWPARQRLYWYNAILTRDQAATTIQQAWLATRFLRTVRACARAARLKQELVMVTWHPQRMMDWCLAIDDK